MLVFDSLQNIRQSKNHRSPLRWNFVHFMIVRFFLFSMTMFAVSVIAQTPADQNNASESPPNNSPKMEKSPKKAIDTSRNHSERLSKEVDSEDLAWISAGDKKFIGLWRADTSAASYGAVILLHAPGETPNTPHTIQALRKNLSLHGWSTLAIELPSIESLKVPKRPKRTPKPNMTEEEKEAASDDAAPLSPEEIDAAIEAESQSKANASTPNKPDPEKESTLRINAAMQFLNDKGQYNIAMVAFGANAVRASQFISSLKPTQAKTIKRRSKFNMRTIRAYIMVDAQNYLRLDKGAEELLPITSYFKDPTLPIMDIYYGSGNSMTDAKKRKSIAKSKKFETYLQVKVMKPSTSDEATFENPLTRRVRGFLDSHARGVEVDR